MSVYGNGPDAPSPCARGGTDSINVSNDNEESLNNRNSNCPIERSRGAYDPRTNANGGANSASRDINGPDEENASDVEHERPKDMHIRRELDRPHPTTDSYVDGRSAPPVYGLEDEGKGNISNNNISPEQQLEGTHEGQRSPHEQHMADEGVNNEKLNEFRQQLLHLTRQKDGLMPNPDGSFPADWLNLAWEYQALAEHVVRSAWPCAYPDGLLPCVNQQVEYLRKRLDEFPSIPSAEKDKFQRLYILAALGIIAKMKLVTFCWTFVELKCNEQRAAAGASMHFYPGQMRPHFNKARRLSGSNIYPLGGPTPEDIERTEYTTRSGRKTHRTAMKPEKA